MPSILQKPLGPGSLLVLQRLVRFYGTFTVLSTLISALSIAMLQLSEFHPATTSVLKGAEGLFVSSTSTAVIAAMLGTMLLFRFEGHEEATGLTTKDLMLAWSPLIILDWSILSFIVGILMWYREKNPGYRADLIGASTGVCLAFAIWVSVDMYMALKRPGGLGREELAYMRKKEEGGGVGSEMPFEVNNASKKSNFVS